MRSPLLKSLLLLSLATANLPALADDGGISGTGGGNSVNHELVEKYVLDIKTAKGHEKLEEKLRMLEKELPDFGAEVRAHLAKLTFYAIPRHLKNLPAKQTGLDFKNEQTAIQKENEVFIDNSIFAGWKADEAAELYMHEAIMNMTASKRSPAVRKAVAKIFERGVTPEQIQLMLVQSNLGFSATRNQIEQLKESRRKTYVERLQKAVENAGDACQSGGTSESVLAFLAARDANQSNAECDANSGGGAASCENFSSPFRLRNRAVNYDVDITVPWWGRGVEANENTVALGLGGVHPLPPIEIPNEVVPFRRKDPNVEPDLREQLAEASVARIMNSFDASLGTFHDLYREPIFVNLLALDAVEHDKFSQPDLRKDAQNGFRSTSFPEIRAFYAAVQARSTELASYPEGKRRDLLCNSVGAMRGTLEKLHDRTESRPTAAPTGTYSETSEAL